MSIVLMVDSAARIEDALQTVRATMGGTPRLWARYLGHGSGAVEFPLDAEEVAFAHANGIGLVLVYNDATEQSVAGGEEAGAADAGAAISQADALGVPAGVYIVCDLEHNWPVSAGWIVGWAKTMRASKYGGAGILYCQHEPWFDVPCAEAMKQDPQNVGRLGYWVALWQGGAYTLNPGTWPSPRLLATGAHWAWQFAGGQAGGLVDVSLVRLPWRTEGTSPEGFWQAPVGPGF